MSVLLSLQYFFKVVDSADAGCEVIKLVSSFGSVVTDDFFFRSCLLLILRWFLVGDVREVESGC